MDKNDFAKNNNTDICYLLMLLLISEAFFSAAIGYAANILVFGYFVFKNHGRLINPFREMKYLYLILFLGAIVGACSYVNDRMVLRDYVRDLYYFTTPVFIILNGAYLKRNNQLVSNSFFNTIIVVAGMQAVYYFIRVVINITNSGLNITFRNWRHTFGDSSPIAATAIVLFLIDSKKQLISIKKGTKISIILLCVAEILFSFSRTNILLVLVTTLVVAFQSGAVKNLKLWFKKLMLVIIILSITFTLLGKTDAIATFIEKTMNSFSEINNDLDWSNVSEIQQNWRGYETYRAILQFRNYPVLHQIIGYGFGERIDVGIYANKFLNIINPDGSVSTTIPVLHNGYSTILCKLGIIGIILYVGFYISLIKLGIRHGKKMIISQLLIAITIGMAMETYILNGLFRESVNYPFIYLIGYLGYSLIQKENDNVRKEYC